MNDDIELFTRLQRLITLSQRINQLSWTLDQARKRYPALETMTEFEMTSLLKFYTSMWFEFEDIHLEWKKKLKEYEIKK